MRSRFRRSPLALPCLFTACSVLTACGAPPEPKPPVVEVASGAGGPATPTVAAEPAAPAEPNALLLVARWKGPIRSAERALKALGVPLSLESLLEKELGAEMEALDFDGSVDCALSLDPASTDTDPKVFGAASIPLRSFEQAVAIADKEKLQVVTIRPGVLRTSKPGAKDECLLVQNPAPTPSRLVCSESAKDLDALGDWLARGLGGTPPENNDLVATVRARPVKDRYLTPLRNQATTLGDQARSALAAQNITDPDLVAAPGILLDEGIQFLQDVDGLEVHISLAEAPLQLAFGGSLRFGGRNAWLTHVLVDNNDKAGPPPAMFWHAPHDAYSASWGRRGDPHLFDGINRVIRKALALGLERLPIPAADKQAVEAFFASAPTPPASWVSAQGLLHGPKKRAAHVAKPSPAQSLAEAKVVATSAIGWHLIGVDAPAPDYVTWGKQLVDLYARAVKLALAFAPPKSKTSDEGRRIVGLIPQFTTVTSLPGWPRGTVAFDLQVAYDSELAELLLPKHDDAKDKAASGPVGIVRDAALKKAKKAKPPGAKASITLRLAIVPDGEHAWIGFSADLDELKNHLNACLDGAPPAGTLATREGLDALKAPGQTWSGFFSIGTLVERAFEEVEHKHTADAAEAKALFASLPSHAQTPILWVGSGKTGPNPTTAGELRFQAGTLADVAAVVQFAMSQRGKDLLKKMDLP